MDYISSSNKTPIENSSGTDEKTDGKVWVLPTQVRGRATVRCNCFETGRTKPLPAGTTAKISGAFIHIHGHEEPEMERAVQEWINTGCEHSGMCRRWGEPYHRRMQEYYFGQGLLFSEAMTNVGIEKVENLWRHCRAFGLVFGNSDAFWDKEMAAVILEELNLLRSALVSTGSLVGSDCENLEYRATDIVHMDRYSSLNTRDRLYPSISGEGFSLIEHKELDWFGDKQVFHSMKFERVYYSDGLATFHDLPTGKIFHCKVVECPSFYDLPNRQCVDGDPYEIESQRFHIEFDEVVAVKEISLFYNLEGACRYSVETGNPVIV